MLSSPKFLRKVAGVDGHRRAALVGDPPVRRVSGGSLRSTPALKKVSGTFCPQGPEGASHKRSLTPFSPRRGVTLVELLVGRRIREAARAINVYFGAARSRAIETGRPVGVLFQRLDRQPQASMVLHQVEIPPPYGGDTLDAALKLHVPSGQPGPIVLVEAMVTVGAISDNVVRAGDMIQLNHQGPMYTVYDIVAPAPSPGFPGNPDSDGDGFIDYNAGVDTAPQDGWYDTLRLWMTIDISQFRIPWPVTPLPTVWSDRVPFVIHRQPYLELSGTRVSAMASGTQPLQLSRGAAVDLAASGLDSQLPATFEPVGAERDLDNDRAPDPGEDTNGNGVFDSAKPVIVMFSPNGSVERVYATWRTYDASSGNITGSVYGGRAVTEPIHFLVGKWERFPADVRDLGPPFPKSPPAWPPAQSDDGWYNWQDATNLWVTLHPQTGLVTVAELNADQLDATTNTYIPSSLYAARQFAREAQVSKGGR